MESRGCFRVFDDVSIVTIEQLYWYWCDYRTMAKMMMINKTLLLTYSYLLIYILLSSGVILYNKVFSQTIIFWEIWIV